MISIPTRRSGEAGATRTLTLRFDIGKRTVRRTVRIVS